MSKDKTNLDKGSVEMSWKMFGGLLVAIVGGVLWLTAKSEAVMTALRDIQRDQFPRAEMVEFADELEDSNPGMVVPKVSIRAGAVEESSGAENQLSQNERNLP